MNQKGFINIVVIIAAIAIIGGLSYVAIVKKPRDTVETFSPPFTPPPQSVVNPVTVETVEGQKDNFPPPRFNFKYLYGEMPWLNQSNGNLTAISFRNYKIYTNSVSEATQYLPIWERLFKKLNNIDDTYFNTHIFPAEIRVNEERVGDNVGRRLYVGYFFKVDWARNTHGMNDLLLINRNGVPLTEEEIVTDAMLPRYEYITVNGEQVKAWSDKKKGFAYVNKIEPANHVAGQEDIISAVEEISRQYNLKFEFDINRRIGIGEDGKLHGRINATIDAKKYRCLQGDILLEDATISNITEYYCGPIQ